MKKKYPSLLSAKIKHYMEILLVWLPLLIALAIPKAYDKTIGVYLLWLAFIAIGILGANALHVLILSAAGRYQRDSWSPDTAKKMAHVSYLKGISYILSKMNEESGPPTEEDIEEKFQAFYEETSQIIDNTDYSVKVTVINTDDGKELDTSIDKYKN